MHIDRVATFHVSDALVSSMTEDGPLAAFRARQRDGQLQHDAAQLLAAEKLQSLHNALKNYQPEAPDAGWMASWRERLGLARRREEDAPQGLYLFGGVGRGKSMLMDLFFASASVETTIVSQLGDVLAAFSERGPTPPGYDDLTKPDITGPGVSIYAAEVYSMRF